MKLLSSTGPSKASLVLRGGGPRETVHGDFTLRLLRGRVSLKRSMRTGETLRGLSNLRARDGSVVPSLQHRVLRTKKERHRGICSFRDLRELHTSPSLKDTRESSGDAEQEPEDA